MKKEKPGLSSDYNASLPDWPVKRKEPMSERKLQLLLFAVITMLLFAAGILFQLVFWGP